MQGFLRAVMSHWLVWTALLLVSGVTTDSTPEQCGHLTDCGSCIRNPRCQWCASEEIGRSTCVHESSARGSWCDGVKFIPESNYEVFPEDEKGRHIVPQHAKLKLRLGETKIIQFTFNKSVDYPIDLYYLMDVSGSMNKVKEKISKLGKTLGNAMKKVTSNFAIGFGSFVDKVAMPYAFTSPSKLKNPCTSSKCAPAYSFKNHMPLDADISLFTKRVEQTQMSSNADSPEGGLDALMQAMVCTKQIGWRPNARRLLFFTTDAKYHIAGDGKLGGVVEPNPGKCFLDDKHEYTAYNEYDYPTISQINRKAEENKIMIIFAVVNSVVGDYRLLSRSIEGSKVEIISEKSENMVQIIIDAYRKFDKTLKIVDDTAGSGIGIVYQSNCSSYENLLSTNVCNNVTAGRPITFEAHISVQECPAEFQDVTWQKTIYISPQGINEKFQLDVEVFCRCPCETEGHKLFQKFSPKCNKRGNLECGVCSCYEGWTGQACECDPKSSGATDGAKPNACITNNVTQEVCNGRGSCLCGQCACGKRQNPEQIISGKHCECDNFSCESRRGQLCSGPDRGHCKCRRCVCEAGWRGKACECPEMLTGCIAPGEEKVCSGHGACECGTCLCSDGRSGKYCGDCVSCPGGRCKEFADCVECMVYSTGKHAASSCVNCSIPIPTIEPSISDNLETEERLCKFPDEAGCSFTFSYKEGNVLLIRAEKVKECPAVVPLWGVILGVAGSTLLLGILIIVAWKIITSIHDRREYEKYMKELDNTKWAVDENPLHVKANTTTVNPLYNRRSRFSLRLR